MTAAETITRDLSFDETSDVPIIAVGDAVMADDGHLGRVERVLRSETAEPRFVVLSVQNRLRRRHPIIPFELVATVDRRSEVVRVRGRRAAIARCSEALPLVG